MKELIDLKESNGTLLWLRWFWRGRKKKNKVKNKREKGWEMCLVKRKRRREKIGGTRSIVFSLGPTNHQNGEKIREKTCVDVHLILGASLFVLLPPSSSSFFFFFSLLLLAFFLHFDFFSFSFSFLLAPFFHGACFLFFSLIFCSLFIYLLLI